MTVANSSPSPILRGLLITAAARPTGRHHTKQIDDFYESLENEQPWISGELIPNTTHKMIMGLYESGRINKAKFGANKRRRRLRPQQEEISTRGYIGLL